MTSHQASALSSHPRHEVLVRILVDLYPTYVGRSGGASDAEQEEGQGYLQPLLRVGDI